MRRTCAGLALALLAAWLLNSLLVTLCLLKYLLS